MNKTNGQKYGQKIITGQDQELQIFGYERSLMRCFFTYFSFLLTFGCVRLFLHWYPQFYLSATHRMCQLSRATRVLIIDNYQGKHKSYFVKDVKVISATNSANSFTLSFDKNNDEIVQRIKDKTLRVHLENGTQCDVHEYRAFWCKKQCYVWDVGRSEFSRLVSYDKYASYSDIHNLNHNGLSREEQLLRRIVYGDNDITIPVQNIPMLLFLELLNPFYIFQVFTLCVWVAEGYYYYTGAIICMSLFGIISTAVQTHQNQVKLRKTVASKESVLVQRSADLFEHISSTELVPGDIIALPKRSEVITCDAVLLTGQCIVNESMLTGESVPVTKTPLPSNQKSYDTKECSHHTLFCGTSIIQTKSHGSAPVLARVIKTGVQTNKGSLVTAILYPPPADFKFDQDSYKFIGILAFIAACGFLYTVTTKVTRGISPSHITIEALDIFTIAIPPALPAAMTVGKLYAQARLKRAQIFCTNSRVINVSGSINCVCFDKTGTLTEDGLDMWGVIPSTNGSLGKAEKDVPRLRQYNNNLFEGMLACHSLTIIDGNICGDPLDVKMFESTGWVMEEVETSSSEEHKHHSSRLVKPTKFGDPIDGEDDTGIIEIIHQHQFSSSLQRMSVITHTRGSRNFKFYIKGSPEVILSLCNESTIPENIALTLQYYTEQGYRVIAMASNNRTEDLAEILTMSRDLLEQNLEFLGLIVMENRLKKPTIPVIKELRDANLRLVMITGDNIQTAISVAKECGILSHNEIVINVNVTTNGANNQPEIFFNTQNILPQTGFANESISGTKDVEKNLNFNEYRFAMTGQTWQLLREHFHDVLPKICVRGSIFARMSSEHKQQLVTELMQVGYYVAMCGDGANDCGALRAAHVGVSLSEAESSVASPLTSRIPDITCVPMVIKQGRAALVTSYGIFKFIVTYSLTEFLSVIILYSIDSNLTDLEFLFIDICLIVIFAFFFGKTRAYEGPLAKKPPPSSLLNLTSIASLILHMSMIITFQTAAYHGVRKYSWYVPFVRSSGTAYACYENYSVFCVSMFQYIIIAIIFSRGKPYRQPVYTNYQFVIAILISVVVCAYITLYPANWIINALQLILPPDYNWRIMILAFASMNFTLCFIIETFVVEYFIERKLHAMFSRPERSKKQYLRLDYELRNNENWPKLNQGIPTISSKGSIIQVSNTNELSKYLKLNLGCTNQNGVINAGYVDDELLENKSITTKL